MRETNLSPRAKKKKHFPLPKSSHPLTDIGDRGQARAGDGMPTHVLAHVVWMIDVTTQSDVTKNDHPHNSPLSSALCPFPCLALASSLGLSAPPRAAARARATRRTARSSPGAPRRRRAERRPRPRRAPRRIPRPRPGRTGMGSVAHLINLGDRVTTMCPHGHYVGSRLSRLVPRCRVSVPRWSVCGWGVRSQWLPTHIAILPAPPAGPASTPILVPDGKQLLRQHNRAPSHQRRASRQLQVLWRNPRRQLRQPSLPMGAALGRMGAKYRRRGELRKLQL